LHSSSENHPAPAPAAPAAPAAPPGQAAQADEGTSAQTM